jgi:hypothetical protein
MMHKIESRRGEIMKDLARKIKGSLGPNPASLFTASCHGYVREGRSRGHEVSWRFY